VLFFNADLVYKLHTNLHNVSFDILFNSHFLHRESRYAWRRQVSIKLMPCFVYIRQNTVSQRSWDRVPFKSDFSGVLFETGRGALIDAMISVSKSYLRRSNIQFAYYKFMWLVPSWLKCSFYSFYYLSLSALLSSRASTSPLRYSFQCNSWKWVCFCLSHDNLVASYYILSAGLCHRNCKASWKDLFDAWSFL